VRQHRAPRSRSPVLPRSTGGAVPGSYLFRETQVPHPQSPYAVSKTAAVQLAQLYAARYEMHVHCVRPFQFIGPRKFPDVVSEFRNADRGSEKRDGERATCW
jgi:nucleoside-diphosphate-sugar epimerase